MNRKRRKADNVEFIDRYRLERMRKDYMEGNLRWTRDMLYFLGPLPSRADAREARDFYQRHQDRTFTSSGGGAA
jgi:hypothetical protein